MSNEILPVGVVGVGHLGRFHAMKYRDHPQARLVGLFDADPERARQVAAELGTRAFDDLAALLREVRAVTVATPTITHFEVVRQCLEAGVHVLVEKPFTDTVAQADALIALQEAQGLVLAVGHLKRLHPAVQHVVGLGLGAPRYIEAERLAPFKPRSLDVDVIMDLMIHDLDLALHVTQADWQEVRAVGVAVVTDKLDMANAWLTFANGTVARIAASRVVREPVRKMRLFWTDRYASIDFLGNSLSIYQRHGQAAGGPIPGVLAEQIELSDTDVLAREVDAFLQAIQGAPVFCDAQAGRRALALAQDVRAAIQRGVAPPAF